MYFCLKCTPVEEVTKSKILDRIEIHVVLLLVACLKAEVSNTKEKVKQNEESGNEAVVVALLQMRGSFCPIPMHKLMNMNPTRLPMSSKAQLEPPPLVRWRVRLWVQDPLGACVTYQLKKKKKNPSRLSLLVILCHWKVPQFNDLPQKSNTGSDRNNDNKNISMSS